MTMLCFVMVFAYSWRHRTILPWLEKLLMDDYPFNRRKGYLLKESAGMEVVNAVRAVYAGRKYLSQQIAETVVDNYILQRQGKPDRSPLEHLSSRERAILQLVVEGKTRAGVAKH